MNSLSEKDEWLSHFNYENLQQQIPELTTKDYSLLITGKPTKEVYQLHDCLGRVSLNLDADNRISNWKILIAEKHPGIPEFVNNTLIGEKERKELEAGKHIPLHNNRVAYYNQKTNCIFSESITNFSLPNKIGDRELSLSQKCKLLNGEKLAVQQSGQSIIMEKAKGSIQFSHTPKGLNPEQTDLLATYQTHISSATESDQARMNTAILQTLGKRYFPKEDPKKIAEKLNKDIGMKGDLSENLKEWFILKNNENIPAVKQNDKEAHPIYEQADNPNAVQKKLSLSRGMKNFHHKVEKSMSKGKEFSSTLIQGM